MPTELLDTQLPEVDPLKCPSQLTFTEWQRIVTQLMARDRVLEEAVIFALGTGNLQQISSLVAAYQIILGPGLVDQVATLGALPEGFVAYESWYGVTNDRLDQLESSTTFTDSENVTRSIKTLALNNEANISALNVKVDGLEEDLASINEVVGQINEINEFVNTINARVEDIEEQLGDLAAEVRNARKEFANDPSKRLVDKIDSIDANIATLRSTLRALEKEVTDARSPDRFDNLAERLGDLESSLENLFELLQNLQGRGVITGLRVGRTNLHGEVELIPGANIAITRERNGYRIDVVDYGTCVDYSAPKIDPNNGCCPPGNANFAN